LQYLVLATYVQDYTITHIAKLNVTRREKKEEREREKRRKRKSNIVYTFIQYNIKEDNIYICVCVVCVFVCKENKKMFINEKKY
jgi:hypothetical protein